MVFPEGLPSVTDFEEDILTVVKLLNNYILTGYFYFNKRPVGLKLRRFF